MPNLRDSITGFVAGDDVDIPRDVTGLGGQTLVRAWLTIKQKVTDADNAALVQLVITPVLSAAGQITPDGTTPDLDHLLFTLTPAQTALLVKEVVFDIQTLTDTGKLYTPFRGTIQGVAQVTLATA